MFPTWTPIRRYQNIYDITGTNHGRSIRQQHERYATQPGITNEEHETGYFTMEQFFAPVGYDKVSIFLIHFCVFPRFVCASTTSEGSRTLRGLILIGTKKENHLQKKDHGFPQLDVLGGVPMMGEAGNWTVTLENHDVVRISKCHPWHPDAEMHTDASRAMAELFGTADSRVPYLYERCYDYPHWWAYNAADEWWADKGEEWFAPSVAWNCLILVLLVPFWTLMAWYNFDFLSSERKSSEEVLACYAAWSMRGGLLRGGLLRGLCMTWS